MDKVTMKIERDIYKELQMFKLENDCKSLSDAIKLLLAKEWGVSND